MKKLLFLLLFIPIFAFTVFDLEYGKVSYYGKKFHGKKTASGEIFDMNKMTCAAIKEYPLGSKLKVTNIRNNKSVIVRVNDRGAFRKYGRTLDLSRGAFDKIANLDRGVIKVSIEKM